MLFLARWARKLSWKETAQSFPTSWDQVCHAVKYVVEWGLQHRTPAPISAIGVDDIQFAKGHKYPSTSPWSTPAPPACSGWVKNEP